MYRALYRKWRPQRFEDVVAQRGIVTALRNQVASGRVGHAYLFTGVRGTGKTTCAKIFAKAVNCLHPHNGDPCGECEICKGIDNGSILDVVEMDAASNNGVDDIRDLRDETAYTPSACHYKVYIIDEVHMLSTAAFNALLKTLEEPPAHVIFILDTTEIQKVPATILSRCQRYDFTRIGPEDIAQRVEYIAGQEGLELTTGGAELISRLADGAMRDALSILDTCAGVTAKIDADVVRRMAGVTDRSYLFHISDALEAQDGAAALAQLAALRQQSVDVKRLTEELIAHYRALMLAALPGGQSLLSGVSPEEEQQYLEKGPQLGQREAIRFLNDLPICPIPNGIFFLDVRCTFLKFTKIPCAVSGLKYTVFFASSVTPWNVLNIRLNSRISVKSCLPQVGHGTLFSLIKFSICSWLQPSMLSPISIPCS